MEIFLKVDLFALNQTVIFAKEGEFEDSFTFPNLTEAINYIKAYCSEYNVKCIHFMGDNPYIQGVADNLAKDICNYNCVPKVEVNKQ